MKVLIARTYPSQLNIASYNVQEIGLASALIRKDIQCDLVFFLEKGVTHTEIRPNGVKIFWIKGYSILKNGFFPGIKRLIPDYDIIQVHEYDQLQSWYIYTFLDRKQNVVIYHGPYYDAFNKGYNLKCKIFDKVFLPFARKKIDSLPCITKSPLAADFLSSKGFGNVTVAGVGLDITPFCSEEANNSIIANRMPQNKKNIIYIGKLEERRNSSFLLRVLDRVSNSCDIFVTIVGDGDRGYTNKIRPEMNKLTNKGILQYVNRANQAELKKVYEKADIMLFPSNYEIYGMVLMEAMYFGVVCISSLNGGASNLITNRSNGVIIDSFDENQWVNETIKLINNPELENMKAAAKREISESFLWDDIVEKFISVYKKYVSF